MTLYSHIYNNGNKLELNTHLHNVGIISADIVHKKKFNFEIDKETIETIAYIIGITHDFAKSTKFFQKERLIHKKRTPQTNHSKLSALFGYAVASKFIQENFKRYSKSWLRFIKLAVFFIIDRHHSELCDIENTKELNEAILEEQVCNLHPDIWEYTFQYNNFRFIFGDFKDTFVPRILRKRIVNDFLKDEKATYSTNFNIDKRIEQIILLILLFSVLMEADKARLILEEEEYQKGERALTTDANIVDTYKSKAFAGISNKGINELREHAYNDVTQKINKIDAKELIYSINLPTGLGKTLTSLSFALKLQKKLGEHYKIIYSLPFLGIIEQTDVIFHEVFEEPLKEYGHSLLLKHHSLSDVEYKSPSYDKDDINKSEFLINIWDSKIVLTTFDQVLYSIFSRDRSTLMRFHNLFNSIIIFDEIQSIPNKLWLLLSEFFKILSKVGNTYFILMTATKPLIFDKGEITELVPDVPYYFNQLNRIILYPRIENDITLEDYVKKIVEPTIKDNPQKDIMIVMNTINSSIYVYDSIKEYKQALNLQRELLYLSTNIIPEERINRIENIRKKNEIKRYPSIIVTTQCVEAGVDIDADIILRDFAPLDCINQVCGRANRHAIKDKGEVWIYKLKDEGSGKYFSDYIYDSVLLGCTEELLKGKVQIHESEFLKLNNEYFSKVKDRMASNEARAIINNLSIMRFSEIDIRKLLRGDKDQLKIDIFVNIDDERKDILDNYKKALQIKNWKERKKQLLSLRKDYFNNTISVQRSIKRKGQIYYPEELSEQIENNGRYIGKEYYDDEIGFDPSKTEPKTTAFY